MLACDGIALQVAGRTLCLDLSFAVRLGEVWGVLGPNGSGKTTLLNTLAGLALPARGAVTIDEQPLPSMKSIERAREVGILPQHETGEFWGTAREYVALGCFPRNASWLGGLADDEPAVDTALQQAGVAPFAARRYGELSGGERQRVRLAQLLAQAPSYLLLDEPLQHLDLHHQRAVMEQVSAQASGRTKRAVVMVLHDVLWPARYCTHALLLDGQGGARAGAAGEVLTQANLEALFDCALSSAGDKPEAGFVPAL